LLCTILKGKFNKIPQSEVLVLGIPRGGIVVGDIVAQRFGYDFDIIIPRRMLAPQNKEMSIGAIMKDNTLYLDRVYIKKLKITDEYLNSEKEKQLREIHKSESILGKQINPEQIKGKYIVLVDDGVATGARLIVSSRWIRQYEPRNLMVLTPICPKPVFSQLKKWTMLNR
jgi:predicted phosphoribosyltransferase